MITKADLDNFADHATTLGLNVHRDTQYHRVVAYAIKTDDPSEYAYEFTLAGGEHSTGKVHILSIVGGKYVNLKCTQEQFLKLTPMNIERMVWYHKSKCWHYEMLQAQIKETNTVFKAGVSEFFK